MVNIFTTCKALCPRPPKEERTVPQFTKGNYQINWIGVIFLLYPLSVVVLSLVCGVSLPRKSFLVALLWLTLSGLAGNTAGYHRLFSHRSFRASRSFQLVTLVLGAGSMQGSARWWARLHRMHHRYPDSDKDPYNPTRGFFFSHCGWFLMRIDYDLLGDVDMSDLDNNPLVVWQRKYYGWLAALTGFVLPFLHGYYVTGSFFTAHMAAHLKICILYHVTFFINSLDHTNWFWAGRTYNDAYTPHDSFLFSFLTFGEGYHNYHHEFPDDYRNGVRWYQWDPTKWFIYACSRLGWTYDLKRAPRAVAERARMRVRRHQKRRVCGHSVGATDDVFENDTHVTDVMTEAEMHRLIKEEGRRLLIVDGYVLDLDKPIQLEAGLLHEQDNIYWYDAHPGGRKFLDAYTGKDATEAMSGGVYKHTHGGLCHVPELRVAHFKGP